MASNYTQTQTYTIPQQPVPQYAQQQPSPSDSASPASPRMDNYLQNKIPSHFKQLRPLKSPLYVPAVLRPTEHFASLQSPMTPPKSLHGSLDSLNEHHSTSEQDTDLQLAISHDWLQDDQDLGSVTGPPGRQHWKPDEASLTCDFVQCRAAFNLFVRKHHCRHCGHIFCSSHVSHFAPLNQSAEFHPDGVESRVCETCHRAYQRWDTARSVRRKNSANSKDGSDSETGTLTGHRRMISGTSSKHGQQGHAAVANSVPKDWAWSTF